MTNREIAAKIIQDKSINGLVDDITYNKAMIFSEFVTNKYATEIYEKYLAKKIRAIDALFHITTVSL